MVECAGAAPSRPIMTLNNENVLKALERIRLSQRGEQDAYEYTMLRVRHRSAHRYRVRRVGSCPHQMVPGQTT